jgi:SAM-dependent methyltransferase
VQNPEAAVSERYSQGAQARESALCCPVSFNPKYLEALPEEIIERDYGCGDPTPFVQAGDVVLDLGSGAGKVCWIAAQVAGPEGRVIGVDMNTEMLSLAQKHHATIAGRVGFDNVTYRRGMIQDLALDLDLLEAHLRENPVSGAESWLKLRQLEEQLRKDHPLIEDNSVDVILSNCVLNLVRPADKNQLFEEIFRVVKPGGRVAISDIVADEDVPVAMQEDPDLWSGCISGAYREDLFLEAFSKVGFHGVEIAKRDEQPWQTVNGYEFRSMTVLAYKDLADTDLDRNQALVYNGPFEEVQDDLGRKFQRGERTPVGERAFQRLQAAPYQGMFTAIEPRIAVPREAASEFQTCRTRPRSAREMKGEDYDATGSGSSSCC